MPIEGTHEAHNNKFMYHSKFHCYVKGLCLLVAINVFIPVSAHVYINGAHKAGGTFEYDGLKYEYGAFNIGTNLTVTGKASIFNFDETIDLTPEFWIDFAKEEVAPGEFAGFVTYVKRVGADAFKNLSIEQVYFSDYLEEIGDYAFAYTSLSKVEIPARVTVIGEGAFLDCYKLQRITLPDNLKTIGAFAFANTNISELELRKSEYAALMQAVGFQGCVKLEKIHLGAGRKTHSNIDYNGGITCDSLVFEDCINLKEIIIGDEGNDVPVVAYPGRAGIDDYVVTFAPNTFKGCSSIEKITVYNDVVVEFGEDAFDSDVYEKATVYVPDGSVDEFKESEQWGRFNNIKELSSAAINNVEISQNDIENTPCDVYTPSGICISKGKCLNDLRDNLPTGIYILRFDNGETRKIVIK